MNSILKNIITLGIGIIIGSFACNILLTYATERNEEINKSDELITLMEELINEKNYYSVSSDNMLFINETLNYEIYSCENLRYNVVLSDNDNEQYSYDFIDTKYGTYYLGCNSYDYTQQTSIATGSFTIEDVWKPNYSLYQNTLDYSDYKLMCENILYNLKPDINLLAVYAINSFPWNKSTQGTPVLLILEKEVIISNAIQSPDGFRVDKMNYSLQKTDIENVIDKYMSNSVGFAIF